MPELDPTNTSQLFVILAVLFMVVLICMFALSYLRNQSIKQAEVRLEEAQETFENKPTLSNRWDVLIAKYDLYAALNLRQNRMVFILSLLLILASFVMIGFGLYRDYNLNLEPSDLLTRPQSLAWIVSGLVTQFFAGTILVIFRSVVQQTSEHRKAHEKFASIGIAMMMLDEVKEVSLKDRASATLSRLVITHQLSSSNTLERSDSDSVDD